MVSMNKNIVVSVFFSIFFSFVFSSFFVTQFVNKSQETHIAQGVDSVSQGELDVVSAVALANNAVVSIVATKDVPILERFYEEISPFWGFGFSVPRLRENGTENREVGSGSGFVVSSEGLIVTNRHVVSDEGASYTVFFNDGTSLSANVIARDPNFDIAIMRIENSENKQYPFLTFGDSESLQLGQTVIAIGNALGRFNNSVSVGVVSGLSRSIVAGDGRGNAEFLEEVIQTDAAINPGNSGGPLLDSQGMVIGVNVAIAQGSGNISFALPAHIVRSIVQSVEEYGEIVRPFLGVRYTPVTSYIAEVKDLPFVRGVIIIAGEGGDSLAVMPGSPADRAGLQEDDVILKINDKDIDSSRSFASMLRSFSPGETISLTIFSQGEEKVVSVELDRFDI